jgi:phytanoyl-CoA hydroxylase
MTLSASRFPPQDIRQFEERGYVVARRLADPAQCARMRALAADHLARAVAPVEYEADVGYPGAPASRAAPGGQTVRRLLQAYARDELFRSWAGSPALGERLKQLLGPRVMLSQAHHNCVMTKNPGFSSVTHWHQDVRYWSFRRAELVSVWLALGREHAGNGCLQVLPGTHTMTFRREQLDEKLFLRADLDENRELLRTRLAVELDEGDVLFFHCRLFHAAGDNQTAETKFSPVFTYRAADNTPLPGTRSASLPEVMI